MKPVRVENIIEAARCPPTMPVGDFGPWKIERVTASHPLELAACGWPIYTVLSRFTEGTMHLTRGEIVMEDSRRELCRHLPIMLRARGRVLVTGLGLGCVVRGLLVNPAVTDIIVVEKDGHIIDAVWPEFRRVEKLLLLQGDAFEMAWPPGMRFDFAWHDIWAEDWHEAVLHAKLLKIYAKLCDMQGAWGMPRWAKRLCRPQVLL